ncbi:beta-ketoacyl synthase N-terminal-like domain-containing protein [Algoriphagus sp.]|uniref:beta-ketoacyl synthase N-terminal-like domain-containing protein n=1 Tax=Algoriphagus sp. TaxID=1872435 RepID=UPI0025F68AB3|nr:beta-ketoacyl synthase N-terminal-like domain-containing protein [Algoriphagus sp.]
MLNYEPSEIIVSGIGITSAIGQGKSAFISALLEGRHNFSVMKRPGRQVPFNPTYASENRGNSTGFLGAEIDSLQIPESISKKQLRTASFSTKVALATLQEAWLDANLNEVEPTRIGLIVGGSNFQQRELVLTHEKHQNRSQFVQPTYGMSFLDSDLCGLCTEVFNIKGFAYTVGGASASGQVAVINAINAVQSGQVDVCIALGALMDLSYWECQALRSLGAMGSIRYSSEPELACRPFDKNRDGFIFGESCGAVVIQKSDFAKREGVQPYARLKGWAIGMDGNRNPNPSLEGEVGVIKNAIKHSGLVENQIDYINPHGSGSKIGDEIELKAISQCGLNHSFINTTKSITGHGLSAAGIVELIATILQMKAGSLHPCRNLDNPMESEYNWVRQRMVSHSIQNALNVSIGFGGINTAVVLQTV